MASLYGGCVRVNAFISGSCLPPLGLLCIVPGVNKARCLLFPLSPRSGPKWKTCCLWDAVSFLVISQLPLGKTEARQLAAKKIPAVPQNWGAVKNLAWNMGAPLNLTLVNGSGFYKGSSEVAVKALYDNEDIYFKITWTDPREDRTFWPWVKTADGWERLVTQPKDETVYYEDKFSFLFPIERDKMFESYGCAVHCHTSPKYRYGYKAADKLVDSWHWKATRTDPVGYAEDQYWLGHDLAQKDVGRFADPDEGGGFTVNMSTDGKTPLYLPAGKDAELQGAILKSKAAPYTKEAADRLPEGTRVPGIVIAPLKGDRGDIKSSSQYRNGKWTLFLRRKLNTGSKYDVTFVPGRYHHFSSPRIHAFYRHQLVLDGE